MGVFSFCVSFFSIKKPSEIYLLFGLMNGSFPLKYENTFCGFIRDNICSRIEMSYYLFFLIWSEKNRSILLRKICFFKIINGAGAFNQSAAEHSLSLEIQVCNEYIQFHFIKIFQSNRCLYYYYYCSILKLRHSFCDEI